MLRERDIPTAVVPATVDKRAKAEADSAFAIITFLVEQSVEQGDDATAQYLFRHLMAKSRFLSRKMGFHLEST